MIESTSQNHRARLDIIVQTSYRIVCQKVAAGSISIYNEASLQLHLGTILKELGQLYEFSKSERFVIELERRFENIYTAKSNGDARCDISAAFFENNILLAQAFIELKYFKKSDTPNSAEATKDNRYGLFMDMENLEQYRNKEEPKEGATLCYEIAIAQNSTYANPNSRSLLNTGNGIMTNVSKNSEGVITYASRRDVCLKGNYMFEWTSYRDDLNCLIINMQ